MQRRWLILVEFLCLAGVCTWLALTLIDHNWHPADSVELKVQLAGALDKVWIFQKDGDTWCQIIHDDGQVEYLSPEKLAELLYQQHQQRSHFQRVLNISAPIEILWVVLGLLGQVLFTGRMLVQWLASEKSKKSVVPPVFWWMSVVGSTMLLVYFLWREDPVGVLGQAFGWFIYIRNLWLIYTEKPLPAPNEDPGVDTGMGK